jgi:MscS family membrane protein
MAVLDNWGYNTSTILAGLGVGGLAIALAAQKTVENLFGGVAVISDRPVSIGDYCKFDGKEGTVEDIGLRSTRVRTNDRTLVTVPNGMFSSMTIENIARRDKMLFHITLNLRRDTKPEQVRALLQSIGANLKRDPRVEEGTTPIRFVGVGAYSLDLEIFVYIRTQNGDEFLKAQQDILLSVLDEIAAAGTALAIPTQASVVYSTAPLDQPSAPAALPAQAAVRSNRN